MFIVLTDYLTKCYVYPIKNVNSCWSKCSILNSLLSGFYRKQTIAYIVDHYYFNDRKC